MQIYMYIYIDGLSQTINIYSYKTAVSSLLVRNMEPIRIVFRTCRDVCHGGTQGDSMQ